MLAPTRKWEADVELRPSENEDVELTPPTVVQEGVVELRRDGEVFSFDWLSQKTVHFLPL